MNIPFTEGESIGDTDFKKYYPNVNRKMNFAALRPYIEGSIRNYIIPYIGWDLYNKLCTDFSSNSNSTPFLAIIEPLKLAISYYTIYDALPHMNAVISDYGVKETSNGEVAPVRLWRFKAIRWAALLRADEHFDQTFEVIDQNIGEDYLSDYADSAIYKDNLVKLFPTTSALRRYIPIHGRRAYLSLLPYLRDAIIEAEDLVCGEEDIFAIDNSIGLALIERYKKYIAHLALFEGLPYLNLLFDGSGFKLVSSTDAFDSKNNSAEISKFCIDKLRPIWKMNLDKYQKRVTTYLRKNPETFTGYASKHDQKCIGSDIMLSDDFIGGIIID